jgi:hypothetical protein
MEYEMKEEDVEDFKKFLSLATDDDLRDKKYRKGGTILHE